MRRRIMRRLIWVYAVCQGLSFWTLGIYGLREIYIKNTDKSLNRQRRIRLHINFFVSFISGGIFTILWNLAITYDRITNSNIVDTHIYKNSGECRVLSFMKIYFNSTNYVWMFCEGLYLYRLIANAFSPPKRLLLFYLFGLGNFPFLYSSAYAIIRLVMADESCWAKSHGGGLEWIIFAPNLFCLVGLVVAIIFCICNGEVLALIKHSWGRRQNALEMVAKRVNSASSLNHYNTVTSRINYQSGDKDSPSRTLISCMKKEESEEATDI